MFFYIRLKISDFKLSKMQKSFCFLFGMDIHTRNQVAMLDNRYR